MAHLEAKDPERGVDDPVGREAKPLLALAALPADAAASIPHTHASNRVATPARVAATPQRSQHRRTHNPRGQGAPLLSAASACGRSPGRLLGGGLGGGGGLRRQHLRLWRAAALALRRRRAGHAVRNQHGAVVLACARHATCSRVGTVMLRRERQGCSGGKAPGRAGAGCSLAWHVELAAVRAGPGLAGGHARGVQRRRHEADGVGGALAALAHDLCTSGRTQSLGHTAVGLWP